jgi:hypothetical protein
MNKNKIFEISANQNTLLALDLAAMLNFQSAPKNSTHNITFLSSLVPMYHILFSEEDYRLKVMTMAHMTL